MVVTSISFLSGWISFLLWTTPGPVECGINASLIHSRHSCATIYLVIFVGNPLKSRDVLPSTVRLRYRFCRNHRWQCWSILRTANFKLSGKMSAVAALVTFPLCFLFCTLLQLMEFLLTCFHVKEFAGIETLAESTSLFIAVVESFATSLLCCGKSWKLFNVWIAAAFIVWRSQCCSRHAHNGFPLEHYFQFSCQSRDRICFLLKLK